jgi:hypothetical protein
VQGFHGCENTAMSEYEALRNDLDGIAKGLEHYSDTAVRHLLEQSTQIDRLWADNAELRDELHALANRVETLTRARLTEPAEVAARMVDFPPRFQRSNSESQS